MLRTNLCNLCCLVQMRCKLAIFVFRNIAKNCCSEGTVLKESTTCITRVGIASILWDLVQAWLDSYGKYTPLLMFQGPPVGVYLASTHSLLLRLSEIFVQLVVHVLRNVFNACATSRGNCSPKKIALNLRMDIARETRTGPHSTCIVRSTVISRSRTAALRHEDKV